MDKRTKANEYIILGSGHLAVIGSYRVMSIGKTVRYIVTQRNNIQIPFVEKNGIEIVADIDCIPDLDKYMICVACTPREYPQMCEMLSAKGMTEFNDYLYYDLIDRKVAIFNMNCYQGPLKQYLLYSKKFCSEYGIYPLPETQQLKDGIPDHILENTDLYIHQDIRPDNKISYKVSTEYAKTKLKKDCKTVCVPNLVGFGNFLYPFQEGDTVKVAGHTFFISDSELTRIIEENTYVEDVIEAYDSLQFDEAETLKKEASIIEKFLKRQEEWDIKIIGYVLDRYKTTRTLIDRSHLTADVMNEINRRTAAFLGLDDIDASIDYELGWESITPASLAKIHGIPIEEGTFRQNTQCVQCTYGKGLTREEYVCEYAFLVNGKMLKKKTSINSQGYEF